MITLLIISFTIFTTYILYVVNNYGTQVSVSDSYYRLPKNRQMLFTFAMWGFAFPIIIVSQNGYMFFAGIAVCFVGVASDYKTLMQTYRVHMISAYGAVVLGMLAMILHYHYYLIPIIFIISFILIKLLKVKNSFWWSELLVFYLILAGLFYKEIC